MRTQTTLRAHDIAYKRPPRVNASDMVREAGGDYRTATQAVINIFREKENEWQGTTASLS